MSSRDLPQYLVASVLALPLLIIYEATVDDPLAWPLGILSTMAFVVGATTLTYWIAGLILRRVRQQAGPK